MTKQWITGWGGVGTYADELAPEDLVASSSNASLSRGLGRAYGDAALPIAKDDAVEPPTVLNTKRSDRVTYFDNDNGILECESGLSLETINRISLPRGWFTPVTPGTHFVTVGGMVAADVHGKNHHIEGCFGQHVETLLVRTGNGELQECTPSNNENLFWACVGGMGMLAHILKVRFRLKRIETPWILQESYRVNDIEGYLEALKTQAKRWPMTVGWIDCLSKGKNLGRGILTCGRWARPEEAPQPWDEYRRRLSVPFMFPSWVINPATVSAFNALYFAKHGSPPRTSVVHPNVFFYPLDSIYGWNKIYGRNGFTQYQCVLPDEAGSEAPRQLLERLAQKGGASFLCVIKDCGPEGEGMLSFPKKGVSVAIDMPLRRHTQEIVDALNRFIVDHGGRIYLAKDLLTRRADFEAMEGSRLLRFKEARRRWDPQYSIRSRLSARLFD